ncbi:LpqN/LpqT family lipoprotein [Mycobacterium spongiae]|uniref:Uncharacterized protein n=1 Tax=Mycobacterium spongiae TaxID=886343 RepID=A0A975JVZ4_9MYCO|nr:LpqN/LpqT family lipoprotein [Mycobacterium spongiae]QUR65708.1 hypothetical protein F6B93_00230 [Mycobacterium spongiae]
MIQIVPRWRAFAAGMATGFLGVILFAGAKATAEPLPPAPPIPAPVPVQTAGPPMQYVPVAPGTVNSRFAPAPAPARAPAPVASPVPIGAPRSTARAPLAPTMPIMMPPITGTLRDYLHENKVTLEAQRPEGFTALDISLPMPPRWTQVPDPNVPDAFAVIADRVSGKSIYTSNAQVVVYKLVGDFDSAEAIKHGYADARRLLAWKTTNASLANFGRFPSSIIEGTYRENDMTLNTSRRHVIASSGADKYLVSLSVTTALSQAIADAPATNAIISGFRVAAPSASGQPRAATPHRAPAALPGQLPQPHRRPAPRSVQSPAPAQLPLTNPTPGHPSLGVGTGVPSR